MRRFIPLLVSAFVALVLASPAAADPWSHKGVDGLDNAMLRFQAGAQETSAGTQSANGPILNHFRLLGHNDLGAQDTNADVWVLGDFAYVGTWGDPCTGRGVKIIDISDPSAPVLIGTVAGRAGTSAEDVVVRHVRTPAFTGSLLATGIQRCGEEPALDEQQFGVEFWDVTDPFNPTKLSEFGATTGEAGVHELDLFQRNGHVYALLATPFSEFFDPAGEGDFRIVDATDPTAPVQVAEWGAGEHGLAPGPFFGQGSFGATFAHSARASHNGKIAYVSYWDLGVLIFDIRDVTNPRLLQRTKYPPSAEGDAHSLTPYRAGRRHLILQNDEDFDPRSPAHIRYVSQGTRKAGLASESPGGSPLWLEPNHRVTAHVVRAANEGCEASDYPSSAAGAIVVVRTPFPFFDADGGPEPLCTQEQQEAAAAAAGAAAVVHDFIADATSPQWFDFGEVDIPVLFTDHRTAAGIVAAGRATLRAQRPSWGFLRVFDARTGRQVTVFDQAPNVHAFPPPEGDWSIHNTEVCRHRAYSSWYSNGIIALDLRPLSSSPPRHPRMVGQFVPEGAPSQSSIIRSDIANVWGVAIKGCGRNATILASDMNSGLWIVKPTGRAAP